MAHCSVLEHNQNPTDRPFRRIKRSGGHSLVRRGLAEWIRENVLLRMRAEMPATKLVSYCTQRETVARPYIPESMPPIIDKMLGIKFDDPVKSPNMPRFRFVSPMEKYRQPLIQV